MNRDPEYRPLASPLYHYTSLEVFQNIYRSKKLWASHISYMNDAQELELGFTILCGLIESELTSATNRKREFLLWLRRWISTDRAPFQPVFSLSFSEDGNMLSQWRSYTPHGRGVSVGFKHNNLIDLAIRAGWHWHSCSYGAESQTTWMQAILSRYLRETSQGNEAIPIEQIAEEVMQRCSSDLFACAAQVKHRAFSQEKEWRLLSPPIFPGDSRIKYRPGKTTLIPYIEFDLTDEQQTALPLFGLIVGPTPHSAMSMNSLIGFQLSERKDDCVPVRFCEIPYREL